LLLWDRGPWDTRRHTQLEAGIYRSTRLPFKVSHSFINHLIRYTEHCDLVPSTKRASIHYHHPPPSVNMRFAIIIASVIAGLAAALPDPTPQGYTGPCSNDNCGVNSLQCGNRLCVPWPSTDPALRKGCTCSSA